MGGTGLQVLKPGVGGTGMDDPGIGGTGIVGVITGFASVCVNGVEVHFDESTPINENEQPVSMRALAVGKVVAIQARPEGQDFVARSITVLNSVVGPVDAIHPKSGALSVLGQTIASRPGVASAPIKVGDWVQASGYRRANGHIEASYVGPIAPQRYAQMTGLVERNMGVDLVVSGTDVNLADSKRATNLLRGDELMVEGVWDGKTLRAQSVIATPTQQKLGAVKAVVVEGFVNAISAKTINLGRSNFALGRDVQVEGGRGRLQDVAVDQLVRMTGRLDEQQQLRVNRIEIRKSSSGGARSASRRSKGGDDDGNESGDDNDSKTEGGSDDAGSGDDSSKSGESGSGKDTSDSGKSSGTSDTSERSESSGKSGSGSSGRTGRSGSSGSSGGSGSSSGSGKGK